MLDCMQSNGMLDEFHSKSLGLSTANRYLKRIVKQIAHRYPRMNLIEIGKYIFSILDRPLVYEQIN
jgi:hybrid polyketide synthase/nonribosomal peptide synthetase ACE1